MKRIPGSIFITKDGVIFSDIKVCGNMKTTIDLIISRIIEKTLQTVTFQDKMTAGNIEVIINKLSTGWEVFFFIPERKEEEI